MRGVFDQGDEKEAAGAADAVISLESMGFERTLETGSVGVYSGAVWRWRRKEC